MKITIECDDNYKFFLVAHKGETNYSRFMYFGDTFKWGPILQPDAFWRFVFEKPNP